MNKFLSYISIAVSLVAIVVSVYVFTARPSIYSPKFDLISNVFLSRVEVGDIVGVTGFLSKQGKFYELHQSELSSSLSQPNGFAYLTIIHPISNISESCNNSWVNVVGTAYWTTFGNSLDLISLVGNLETGKSCFVSDKPLTKRYLETLMEESNGKP